MFSSSKLANYKIPKRKAGESESNLSKPLSALVRHATVLMASDESRRSADAYDYLVRHLSDSHWRHAEVVPLLAKVALGLANGLQKVSQVCQLNEVVNRLKRVPYVEHDFWDALIAAIVKRICFGRCEHHLNVFLAGLYNYLLLNGVKCRHVNNEAVIAAYRQHSPHITA